MEPALAAPYCLPPNQAEQISGHTFNPVKKKLRAYGSGLWLVLRVSLTLRYVRTPPPQGKAAAGLQETTKEPVVLTFF